MTIHEKNSFKKNASKGTFFKKNGAASTNG